MISGPSRMVWLCAALAGLAPPAFALDTPLGLAEVRELAEAGAPQLAASRARADAAREMISPAGALPDPVLKLGINNLPASGEAGWNLGREGMTMRSVSVMQELTRDARRDAKRERASREAGMFEAEAALTRLAVRRDAALAWLDLAYAESMRSLIAEQLEETRLSVQAAGAAFRSGRGGHAALVAGELAVGRNADQLAAMELEVSSARARLERWIGEAAARPTSGLPAWDAPPAATLAPERLASHPGQQLAERRAALAEAEVTVSREARKPDLAVELMYSRRGPAFADMVSLNVSMPLPWDRPARQDRELAASLARGEAARAEREDAARDYRATLTAARLAWQSGRGRLIRYDKELIPLASGRIAAVLAAYRGGNASLDELLEARRALLDTRMERQRIALETARARVQLEYLEPPAELAGRGDPS